MKMKNLIVVFSLAFASLSLAGCASLSSFFSEVTGSYVSAKTVYLTGNVFIGLEKAATAYDRLPLCVSGGTLACRTVAGRNAVDKAVRAGDKLVDKLYAYVDANPGELVPVSNYNALLAVISTIESYTGTPGVSQ